MRVAYSATNSPLTVVYAVSAFPEAVLAAVFNVPKSVLYLVALSSVSYFSLVVSCTPIHEVNFVFIVSDRVPPVFDNSLAVNKAGASLLASLILHTLAMAPSPATGRAVC